MDSTPALSCRSRTPNVVSGLCGECKLQTGGCIETTNPERKTGSYLSHIRILQKPVLRSGFWVRYGKAQ